MKRISPWISGVWLATSIWTLAWSEPVVAEPAEEGVSAHGHRGPTLFLVKANSAQVVPPAKSSSTATGAFIVDPAKTEIEYDLTYHGLEKGPPRSIVLRNFDRGANGVRVFTLCGAEAIPCPDRSSGNLRGRWDGHGPVTLDARLLGEIASARVYLEITGGNGKPELRGQLEPNGTMLPHKNYVAHLEPTKPSGARGAGTAVMSEVYYSDGRVSVVYEITVAGTSGTPRKAALMNMPASSNEPVKPPVVKPERVLPRMQLAPSKQSKQGGTLSGHYEALRKDRAAVTASGMLLDNNTDVGISVATSTFPQGELHGVFKRVH